MRAAAKRSFGNCRETFFDALRKAPRRWWRWLSDNISPVAFELLAARERPVEIPWEIPSVHRIFLTSEKIRLGTAD